MDVEEKTRNQGNSNIWFQERQWRLTASNFGSICKATDRMDKRKKCETLYKRIPLSTAPIIYGKTHEKIAARKYEHLTGANITATGLFIHPEYNFLAGNIFGNYLFISARPQFSILYHLKKSLRLYNRSQFITFFKGRQQKICFCKHVILGPALH